MGDLSQGIEGRDGIPVLDPEKIAKEQPGSLFDVALGHAFLQPVGPDCGANVHAGKSSETLSSLRECLNSNQSWNFVQAQFFHKFRFIPRLVRSICMLNLKNLGRIAMASVKVERSRAQDDTCCLLTKFVRPASSGSPQAVV